MADEEARKLQYEYKTVFFFLFEHLKSEKDF